MKKLIMLALAIAIVTAVALPVMALTPPAEVDFDAPEKSPVVFNHDKHEHIAGDCKVCHHMGIGNGKCNGCHGVSAVAPTMKRAMHKRCKGCHARMKVSSREDCGFCHQ